MKTGKITALDPCGSYSNNYGTFNKTKVTFANGTQYTFSSKGQFKNNIGDEISYEITNEEYKNAKLVRENPMINTQVKSNDTHQSILKQVAFKGAIELCSNGKITLEQIKQTTEYFYTKILND